MAENVMARHSNVPIRALGVLATITSGGTPDRANAAFWNGAIPWVKTTLIQNRPIQASDIDEYITEEGLKHSSAKIIKRGSILMAMIGQGKTRGQVAVLDVDAAINQNCAAIILHDGVDRDYVYQQLLYRYEEIRNISNSSGQQNLNAVLIRSIKFPAPSLSQQREIGALLKEWDAAIEKTEQLIVAKEQRRQWLIAQLLSGNIRLPVFKTRHWRKVRFGEIFLPKKVVNNEGRELEVLSVTKDGVVRQSDYFNKEVASVDKSQYLIVSRGDLVMSGLNFWMGSIDFQNICDQGIVSPAYRTFEITKGTENHEYMRFFVRSPFMTRMLLCSSVQGASIVRRNLDMDELNSSKLHLPDRDEQTAIAEVLTTAENEVHLHKQHLEALKLQKRGLMQKLMTAEWRVKVPKGAEVA